MKRFLLPAALALAITGGLISAQQTQQPAPVERQSGRQHEHHARDPHKAALKLGQKLNLTADQTAKVEPILADHEQKVAALRANTQLDPKSRKQQMHALKRDTTQQLSGILTPEQVQQMKAMHHGHHGGAHTDAPAPAA